MSKKILAGLILAGILLPSLQSIVLAQTGTTEVTPEELPTWSTEGVLKIINRITNWLFTFLMAAVVIMVLVSAYMFVTAGGNPEQRSKATQVLMYALIGFAIGMLAKGVIALVSAVIGKKMPEWKWK